MNGDTRWPWKIVAHLDVPEKDLAYVQLLWDQGDLTALREYIDNQYYFEIDGIVPSWA